MSNICGSSQGYVWASGKRRRGGMHLLFLASLLGCSSGEIPTYPAGGTLKLKDGTPLEGCLVTFRPLDSSTPNSARGEVQADGSFRLSTFHENDGAVAGQHQVALGPPSPPAGTDRDAVRMPPPPFALKYSDFDASGLSFEVTRNAKDNHFEIIVEPFGK